VRFDVRTSGRRVQVIVQDTLPADTTIVVVLGTQLQDARPRDNRISREIAHVYSTGPRLGGGSVLGRVTIKGRAERKGAVAWEPVPADTTRGRRASSRVAATDSEGLFRLVAVPADRRFVLRGFLDANDNLRLDSEELAGTYPETLSVQLGETRRGLSWNVIDPNEPAQLAGVALNQSGIDGPVAVGVLILPAPGRPAASDSLPPPVDSLALARPLPRAPRAESRWAQAYVALDSTSRADWRVVYASARGDYSVRVPPGPIAILAFVDVRRDSVPGWYVRPDSSAVDSEPLGWGERMTVTPGERVRVRTLEIR
jgi:hypothetical protein